MTANVFNSQLLAAFVAENRFVLRAMIFKRASDILHKRNQIDIKHEKNYLKACELAEMMLGGDDK